MILQWFRNISAMQSHINSQWVHILFAIGCAPERCGSHERFGSTFLHAWEAAAWADRRRAPSGWRKTRGVCWQTSGKSTPLVSRIEHIYTNTRFHLVCLHLMNECWKLAVPLRKAICFSETMVETRFRNVAVVRISCQKWHWRSRIVRRLAVNILQESNYWHIFDGHLRRRFTMFCVTL